MLLKNIPFHPFTNQIILPKLPNVISKINRIKIINERISDAVVIKINFSASLRKYS